MKTRKLNSFIKNRSVLSKTAGELEPCADFCCQNGGCLELRSTLPPSKREPQLWLPNSPCDLFSFFFFCESPVLILACCHFNCRALFPLAICFSSRHPTGDCTRLLRDSIRWGAVQIAENRIHLLRTWITSLCDCSTRPCPNQKHRFKLNHDSWITSSRDYWGTISIGFRRNWTVIR
jgi:hypothetical protein